MLDATEARSLADHRADASRSAIVEAAWRLSRSKGLTGWSLRELAREVGVKAPTLYAYVDSKHAIYDEMFRAGWEEFEGLSRSWRTSDGHDRRAAFTAAMRGFVEFATSDITRYQLMFQRVIPEFEPSPAAYAASLSAYEVMREQLAQLGVTEQEDLDLLTAITAGLTAQQISNEPGGDRWTKLLDVALELFFDHVGIGTGPTTPLQQEEVT